MSACGECGGTQVAAVVDGIEHPCRACRPETILEEAQRLVYGPRQANYGHPFDDFSRTGKMWGAILGIPAVPPEKVALCMAAVKISREVNAPKHDNVVDLAGYAGTLELVKARRREIEA